MLKSKKAELSYVRDVIIGLILLAVLFLAVAIASGQANKWINYVVSLLRIG